MNYNYSLLVVHGCAIFRNGFSTTVDEINPSVKVLQSVSIAAGLKILCNESQVDFIFIESSSCSEMTDSFFKIIEDDHPNCIVVLFANQRRFLEIQSNCSIPLAGFIPFFSDIYQWMDEISFYIYQADKKANKSKIRISDYLHLDQGESNVISSERHLDQGESHVINSERHIDGLSKKQLEIARLLRLGLTNREISERVYLSEGTVKNYISQIFERINVSNRMKAAIKLSEYSNL